ncbi:MAG TPA: site-specific integrase [Terriglobales bacterium]|nr:site-specific integrase [Terriglobales bacterium]
MSSDDLNLAAYTGSHRTRQRGLENGHVKKTGGSPNMWRGFYHVYVPGSNGTDVRQTRKKILGPVAEMTKGEAEEALRVFIRRLHSLPAAETGESTIATLCDDFLLLREGDWEKDSTLGTNTSVLRLIKAGLGDRPVDSVKPLDLKTFMNSLAKRTWKTPTGKIRKGISDSYVKKVRTNLRAIFDLAIEKELITKNPTRSQTVRITIPKEVRTPDKTVLPPQELPLILAELSPRDQLVVWLAVFSMRPNEVFAVKGRNVGPDWIHVEEALTRRRNLKETKNKRRKFVVLPAELKRITHEWLRENRIGPNDFLFTTKAGMPVSRANFLNRRLRPAAKRAGITTLAVDFQMLRRSFATLANAIGFDIKSIQEQMGHARPDMSMIEYAQPVDDERRRQVQRMENMLLGKEPIPVDLTAKLGSRLVN